MNMSTVQPINFQGKSRYLSDNAYSNMKSILTKMNNDTSYMSYATMCPTSRLTRLKLHDNSAMLCDNRFLYRKVDNNNQMRGTTLISTKNAQVEIDNESGRVKGLDKPLFSTWSSVIDKIEQAIQIFEENFENSRLIERGYISFFSITKNNKTNVN